MPRPFRAPGRLVATALTALLAGTMGAGAAIDQKGPMTGLPVPRYVSLKSDRVNLREGPSKDHRSSYVFERAGLPVEVTAEFDTWRKIRDSEGTEGWVLHSLLSGRRTALIAPWKKDKALPLYRDPRSDAEVVANLQPGSDRQRQEMRRPMVPHLRRRLRRLRAAERPVGRLPRRTGGVRVPPFSLDMGEGGPA